MSTEPAPTNPPANRPANQSVHPLARAARLIRAFAELVILLAIGGLLVVLAGHLQGRGAAVMGEDTAYYLEVARRIAGGELPYRDFTFEYPPLALIPILLPFLAWLPGNVTAEGYSTLLVIENLLLAAATAVALAWLARRGWSAHRPATTVALFAMLAAATPVLLWRYDAFPALLATLAVCLFAAGRAGTSGALLGLGAVTKLYPLAFLPLLALAEVVRGHRGAATRLAAGFLASSVLAIVGLAALAGADGFTFVTYQASRGVQLESVLGSVVLLGHLLGVAPASTSVGFSSWQVDSSLADAIGWLGLLVPLGLGLMLLVSAVVRYRADVLAYGVVRPQTQVAHLAAALLVAILSYRVLSPQFLVWLLPLAALLPRPKVSLLLFACALTLYLFPVAYRELVELDPWPIVVLAIRNLALAGLFGWLVGPGFLQALGWRRQSVVPTSPQGARGSR